MRIQVRMETDLVKKIDKIAKELGLSRSTLCSIYILKGLKFNENLLEDYSSKK